MQRYRISKFAHSFLIGLKVQSNIVFLKRNSAFLPPAAQTQPLQLSGRLLWPTKVNTPSLACSASFRFLLQPCCPKSAQTVPKISVSLPQDHNCTGKARQWDVWLWNPGRFFQSLHYRWNAWCVFYFLSTLYGKQNKYSLWLQTYGLQLKDSSAVEMCTFVRKVQEDSPAESAGLTAGETPTSSVQAVHMLSHTFTHTKQGRPYSAFCEYIDWWLFHSPQLWNHFSNTLPPTQTRSHPNTHTILMQ